MAFEIPFITPKTKQLPIAPYGGDIRPSVWGPHRMSRVLAQKSFMTVMLSVSVILCGLLAMALLALLVTRMGTQLYVADGSAFGCRVPVIGQ
tara:strand:- start:17185 stop:17460 length:276 start_codon:yes stop_codon:yes gene_type:complete